MVTRRAIYSSITLIVLALLLVTLLIPSMFRFAVQPYTYLSENDVPKTDVALILGASVYHNEPTLVLEERIHRAINLYIKGKVSKIMVTGDNGALSHDEVTPVRKFLLASGIPSQDIFLDHAGFDTYSSMYRARDVFQVHSVTIVTQDFHMPRPLFIARSLGLNAYGLVADDSNSFERYYLREIPASLKALLDLVSNRTPKYLGPAIPITGDGQVTWY